MILIDKQPEEIGYSTQEYTNKGDNTDVSDTTEIGTCKILIGEYTFNNVPFTVGIATGQIRNLSASLKSVTDQNGVTQQEEIGLSQTLTLKYSALPKTQYDSWLNNIGKVVEVDIDNLFDTGYSEDGSATSVGKAVDGEFMLKKLTAKTTPFVYDSTQTTYQPYDDTVYNVVATFVKNAEYGTGLNWDEEGGSDGELGYIDYETIFDSFNPLEDIVDVFAYINGEVVFEGYLDNITSSTLKALGKERDLADYAIYRSFTSSEDAAGAVTYNSNLTKLSQDSLQEAGYSLSGNIDSEPLDANILDTSIWNIVSRCCKDVGLYFYAEGNQVFVSKASTDVGGAYGKPTVDITDVITSTNYSFKGSKYYDSLILNANYRFFWDTYMGDQNVGIKCYNKLLIAGNGLDYSIMESVPTSIATASDTSFECVVDVANNFYDISASETKYSFIPTTMIDTETKNYDSYWGSIVIEVDQELGGKIDNVFVYNGTKLDDEADFDYFISKTWIRNNTQTFDGNVYFHIFETGDIDEVAKFTVVLSDVKLPPEDLYDGYRKWGEGNNVLNHTFCYKQSISTEQKLDLIANHITSLRNAEMKQVEFICKGIIDVRPGEYVSTLGKNFYISKIQYKIDKNQAVTTVINGSEYVYNTINRINV